MNNSSDFDKLDNGSLENLNEQEKTQDHLNSHELADADYAPKQPLHRRMFSLPIVRYFRLVIGDGFSMLFLCVFLLLIAPTQIHISPQEFSERVRSNVIASLGYVLPDYVIDLGQISLDFSANNPGWLVAEDLLLLDPVSQRTVIIKSMRFSPNLMSWIGGDFTFSYIDIAKTEITALNELPSDGMGQPLILPINIMDIPADILSKNGVASFRDMTLRMQSAFGEEILSLQDFSANMIKLGSGYTASISTKQIDNESGLMRFQYIRDGEDIEFQGFAKDFFFGQNRSYALNFDLNLKFRDIAKFDTSIGAKNAVRADLNLHEADGNLKISSSQNADGLIANLDFDEKSRALTLSEFEGQMGEFAVSGKMLLRLEEILTLSAQELQVQYPTRNGIKTLPSGYLEARFIPELQRFDLGEFSFGDVIKFRANGRIAHEGQWIYDASMHTDGADLQHLREYWPENLAEDVYELLETRFMRSELKDLQIDLTGQVQGEQHYQISAKILNTEFVPVDFLPPAIINEAFVNLTDKALLISAGNLAFDLGDDTQLQAYNPRFFIDDWTKRPIKARFDVELMGALAPIWESFRGGLDLSKRTNIAAARLSGAVKNGRIRVDFPIKQGITMQDMDIDIHANIEDFALMDFINGRDLSAQELRLDIDETKLALSGDVNFSGAQAQGAMNYEFASKDGAKIALSGNLDEHLLSAFEIDAPSWLKSAQLPYQTQVTLKTGALDFTGAINAQNAQIILPGLGQVKSKGEKGAVEFRGKYAQNALEISEISVNLGQMQLKNGALLFKNNRLQSARFPIVDIQNLYENGSADYSSDQLLTLKGGRVDLRALQNRAGQGGASASAIKIRVEDIEMQITHNILAQNANGDLRFLPELSGSVNANISGVPFAANVQERSGQYAVDLTSPDAGQFLRALHLYSDLRHGKLSAKLLTHPKDDVISARISVKKALLMRTATLTDILRTASLVGVLNVEGLGIDIATADAIITPEFIRIYGGQMHGPALGISLGGDYFPQSTELKLDGVVSPFYIVNGTVKNLPLIGNLLGSNDGEGLFGVRFGLRGHANSDPMLRINPLSLLTPGFIREIWGDIPQKSDIPEQYRIPE